MRVSSGHLCVAEAPTAAAAENAGRYFSLPFLRKGSGVRVSSGHLCEAEAPTEAVAENAGGTPARCRTESCGTEWKAQEGEQKVSSGHFLRGETLVRGFPLREAEAPPEAVDLRGRGGSLCPPVK